MEKTNVPSKSLSATLLCFVFIALTQLQVSHSLSCVPCDRSNCPPLHCVGGTHLDVCGCCQTCSKQTNEKCGGPFEIYGKCDKGLTCFTEPQHEHQRYYYETGTCLRLFKHVICEQSKRTIRCSSGQVIQVINAFYGRKDRSTCPNLPIRTTTCPTADSSTRIRNTCDGQNFCVVNANNFVFGDPCYGTTKYVEIDYICNKPIKPIKAIICESDWQRIACPPGQAIHVESGFYGRDDLTTCLSPTILTKQCKAVGSLHKLEEMCNRRNSCSIDASNSVFKEPCYGTTKYVQMMYRCVKH